MSNARVRRARVRRVEPRSNAQPRAHLDERANALFLAATELHRAGCSDDALNAYDGVLSLHPAHVGALNLSGLILADLTRPTEAVARFEAALLYARSDDPNLANIHNNLGLARRALGDEQAASVAFEAALVRDRNHAPALANLAQSEWKSANLDRAVALTRRSITADSNRPDVHALLGAILHDQGRLDASRVAFERAIALGETSGDSHAGLGATLRLLGDTQLAESALTLALASDPQAHGVRSTLALAMLRNERFERAVHEAEIAAQAEPDHAQIQMNYALVLLAAGRCEAGWDALEATRGRGTPITFSHQRVHLGREEGLGDEILYASLLGELINDARAVTLECDPRIAGLLARTYPEVGVNISPAATSAAPDIATGMGAVAAAYRRKGAPASPAPRRLVADPDLVASMRAWRRDKFGDKFGDRPLVALSWRSGLVTAERRLEYPHLEDCAALFGDGDGNPSVGAIPGVQSPEVAWVNVQYDDCERELLDAERRFGLHIDRGPGIDLKHDQEGLAALLTICDAVVTPRNAVAMLAGALGTPCVMLGNRYDWFDFGANIEDTGSPWFPSVHPILRAPGDSWPSAIERAAVRVRSLLADSAHSADPHSVGASRP